MQAQFARGGEPSGIAHAEPMPSDLPPPEECPSRADMLAELLTRAPASLRPHSIGFPSPKLGAFATLDHSMWFHAPFKADEWLLYEMSSPHAGAGRALCFGHLYRPDTGQLVVSVAQQGVLRLAKPSLASKAAIAGWRGANLLEWLRAKLGIG